MWRVVIQEHIHAWYGCGISTQSPFPNFKWLLAEKPSSRWRKCRQFILNEGDASIEYSVSPTGTSPFSYQWLLDNKIISGATNDSYLLHILEGDTTKTFSYVVSNLMWKRYGIDSSLE